MNASSDGAVAKSGASGTLTPVETTPGKPRWKRLLQNLALSVGVFLLCAIGLELVLRLNHFGNLEIYEPDPMLYWRLKPNQDCYTKVHRKPVHINSRGTRGPEFTEVKPTGVFRILSLGDSRTFGWGLAEEETYSHKLETLLSATCGPNGKVEVINAGVNAWSFQQMLAYYRNEGARFQPDVVILGEANLWTQFSDQNNPEFVKQFMRRVRLKNLLRRSAIYHYVVEVKLKSYYEKYRTRFIPVSPDTDPLFKAQQQANPNHVFQATIEEFCRLARTNGATPVLLYLPTEDDLTRTNQPAIAVVKSEVAHLLKVPYTEFDPGPDAAAALYLDGDPVHFNARGNELIAQRLLETVKPLVQ